MSDTSAGTQRFEDHRWSTYRQEPVWRHRAACRLIRKAPIVDVGGGDALLLSMLREAGWNDLALADLSPVAVSIAKEAGFSAHVVDASQRLPFDDKSVGTACALDVLEHLDDPRAVLLEMARVADDVVIVVPNFHYWRERVQMLLGRIPFPIEAPARSCPLVQSFDADGAARRHRPRAVGDPLRIPRPSRAVGPMAEHEMARDVRSIHRRSSRPIRRER